MILWIKRGDSSVKPNSQRWLNSTFILFHLFPLNVFIQNEFPNGNHHWFVLNFNDIIMTSFGSVADLFVHNYICRPIDWSLKSEDACNKNPLSKTWLNHITFSLKIAHWIDINHYNIFVVLNKKLLSIFMGFAKINLP